MSVPPYVCACAFTIAASYAADRVRRRGVFLLGFQLTGIAGFALLAGTSNTSAQYAGLVLAAVGVYPTVPLAMAWNSGNIGGSLKRGTGIAMQVMGGNCGGIIASYVYLSRDGPRYITGHSILIGIIRYVFILESGICVEKLVWLTLDVPSLAFLLTLFMTIWYRIENARRDRVSAEVSRQEMTEEQKALEQELADNAPFFRYTV